MLRSVLLLKLLHSALFCAILACGVASLRAQTASESQGASTAGDDDTQPSAATPFIRPVIKTPIWSRPDPGTGINWKNIQRESNFYLGIQHLFRIGTEKGTREGLKGPFFEGYADSVGALHGWADGDPFYVNYIGHPLQGSASGFVFAQNDQDYIGVEFGRNRDYWRSRLRAAAYNFAYSTQFEIGPISEASIGNIQAKWPQQGMVDLVITPTLGTAVMIGEDALDKYVIQWFERRVENPYVVLLVRAWLNPSRSWANAMRWKVPWARDDRPGVFTGYLKDFHADRRTQQLARPQRPHPELDGQYGLSPFEFSMDFRPTQFFGNGGTGTCWGGGAEAAFRMSPQWQLVGQTYGCNLTGLEKNVSGDTLSFLVGPRWSAKPTGRWNPYAHFLVGGMKVTQERLYPELKAVIDQIPKEELDPKVQPHDLYTKSYDANGWAISAGTGIDVRLTPALAWRAASLEYKRAWMAPVNGHNYNQGLAFTTSFVLRMGTW